MKIEFNRASLAAAIGIVQTVIPSKTPKPILQNLLLEVRAGKATLTATDSEISIRHDVADVTCDGNTSVLLPRRVGEVLRELRDDRVTLEIEEKKIQLCGVRSKFNIPTENPADFPAPQPPVSGDDYTLPGNLLKKMIRRTVFATSQDGDKYYLAGVCFDVSNLLTMVATDSRRLSIMTAEVEKPKGGGRPIPPIVPAKALSLLERTLPDSPDAIHLAFDVNQVVFTMGHAVITSRLAKGRFPRWKDFVPRSHDISVDLIAGMLHGVIRQALIFTSEESRGVDFHFTEGTLRLTSQAPEAGDSDIELPIGFDGSPAVVRLDPRFVSEFLKTIPAECQISFKLTGEENPVVITTDDNTTYVIMPLSREG